MSWMKALQSQDSFRTEITTHDDGLVTLRLFGDLDLVSVPRFETALAAVFANNPRQLIFDVSAAHFVSGQGFAMIGRCSHEIAGGVAVCSRGGLASRVLRALGYDGVECIDTGGKDGREEPDDEGRSS
jgi:anti-anti-sigma regulatory factor